MTTYDLPFSVAARCWRILNLPPGVNARHDARRQHHVVARLLLLHAHVGQRLPVALVDVDAGIVEELELRVPRHADDRVGVGHQVGAGRLEVVVGLRDLAGAELVRVLPTADVVLHGDRAEVGRIVDLLLLAVDVGRGLVAENHLVLAVGVLEEVEDALLFHQPRHEVEVRLPVLDAVLALGVVAGELQLEIGEAAILEDLLDDVGRRHLLEDAAVGVAREKPQPRHDLGPVAAAAVLVLVARGESADHAVESAAASRRPGEC